MGYSADEDAPRVSAPTIADYEARADEFWERTRDHDVSQNIEALLKWLPVESGARILDFGCGPGRDLRTFAERGHTAIGLDGCPSFVRMARVNSGCEVWLQDFLRLELPAGFFDAVYANATLFHVPRSDLPRVLREIAASLRKGGVLFASIPRGGDEEGWAGARYGVWHSVEGWRRYLLDAGYVELDCFLRPAHLPPEERRWLASVWRVAG